MVVSHLDQVSKVPMSMAGAEGVFKKILISPEEGWEGYVMRLFEIEEDGHTPRHQHPWPHINFVADGRGTLYLDGEEHELRAGSFAYVPAGKEHQFSSKANGHLSLICIVPQDGEK